MINYEGILKRNLVMCLLAVGLLSASLSGRVSAKTETIAAVTRYDLDGNTGRDRLEIKGKDTKGDSLIKELQFTINGKAAGSVAVPQYPAGDITCELVKTRAKAIFLMVNGTVGEDDSDFVLLSLQNGRFAEVLKASDVIEAKKYVMNAARITYQKRSGKADEQFVVHSVDSSESLGAHDTEICYAIKGSRVVKKSPIYRTKVLYAKTLTAARKITVYASPISKEKVFTLKKGDKVKISRYYDAKKGFRIFVKRTSDGKKGWVNGIKNYTGNPLFEGVSMPEAE